METSLARPQKEDDDLHMGSEYANAQSFLAREPRVSFSQIKRKKKVPAHGSNDSDFGVADQKPD